MKKDTEQKSVSAQEVKKPIESQAKKSPSEKRRERLSQIDKEIKQFDYKAREELLAQGFTALNFASE